MKLYRFSPINSEQEILNAFEHIYAELLKLRDSTVEEKWPIYTLKLFAHYKDEYHFLMEWVNSIGQKESESSQTSYYVKPNKPFIIRGQEIPYIGVRVQDPYRPHVGCGDFEVKNYREIKDKYLGKVESIREIEHSKYEMLELFNPDVDILGYIVRD